MCGARGCGGRRRRPGREAGAAAGVGRSEERRAPGSRTQRGLREASAGPPPPPPPGVTCGAGGRGGSCDPGGTPGPGSALEGWTRAGQAEPAADRTRARDPLGLVTHFIPVTARARLERRPMGRWGGQLRRRRRRRRAPALAVAGRPARSAVRAAAAAAQGWFR